MKSNDRVTTVRHGNSVLDRSMIQVPMHETLSVQSLHFLYRNVLSYSSHGHDAEPVTVQVERMIGVESKACNSDEWKYTHKCLTEII